MLIDGALADAAGRLATVSGTPRLDAEILMAYVLGITREALLLGDRRREAPHYFTDLVARRMAHEPIAYITGCRAFWDIELNVSPGVLIPRPDSETLIEAAIDHFGARSPAAILDMGTGSGALLLAALSHWPDAKGRGIDTSPDALAVATANADRLGLSGRATFALESWDAGATGVYDLVLCNPPYIGVGERLPIDVAMFEPAAALYAGPDGMDAYRAIAPVLRLPAGGVACVEIGATQGAQVSALFAAAGFSTRLVFDLAGRERCVVLTWL